VAVAASKEPATATVGPAAPGVQALTIGTNTPVKTQAHNGPSPVRLRCFKSELQACPARGQALGQ
jgi:hypothetical protein